MSVWPMSGYDCAKYALAFWTSNRTKVNDSERSKYTPLWLAFRRNLRERLPEELKGFDDSVLGDRNGSARPKFRHVWYDGLPNIHFEVQIDGNEANLGLHISDMGRLAAHVVETVDEPSGASAIDLHADSRIMQRLSIPTRGICEQTGLDLAAIMAREIVRLVPLVQSALRE